MDRLISFGFVLAAFVGVVKLLAVLGDIKSVSPVVRCACSVGTLNFRSLSQNNLKQFKVVQTSRSRQSKSLTVRLMRTPN